MRVLLPVGLFLLLACPTSPGDDDSGSGGGSGGSGGGDVTATCTSCVSATDCPAQATCVQYAGSDYCGHICAGTGDCASGESCLTTSAADGTQVMVCVPDNGTCGQTGCGTCSSGTTCDPIVGACISGGTGGGSGGGAGGGSGGGSPATCGVYDLPDTSSCCKSCTPGTNGCPANGCYSGWWCDRTACTCHPASLGSCGGSGGGGGAGGGGAPFTYTGSVGIDGGAVSDLYFAVVGDTRPPLEPPASMPTSGYPTAVITKIFQDISALSPKPQFVIATGDYMYASPSGTTGASQIALYQQARMSYSGVVFPAMGNHECNGLSDGNCATTSTNNLQAYITTLMTPIKRSKLYYTFDVKDTAGHWTAKFIVVACNAWDSTQASWLTTQLARSTTYTFIARHMPIASNGPCNAQMDATLSANPSAYTGLLTGHTHSAYFSPLQKELVEGVGGAPITGTSNYGYATVRQKAAGGFDIVQYDYSTNQPVATWSLP